MKRTDPYRLQVKGPACGLFLSLFLASFLLASSGQEKYEESLKGKFLVAVGTMEDPRFEKSVIYLVEHDRSGAMGLIVNRIMGEMKGSDLAGQLEMDTPSDHGGVIPVHFGGPVEPARLFLLHSDDSRAIPGESLQVEEKIGISTDPEILRSYLDGDGPRHLLLIQGYSGWGPGQLERELGRGDWKVLEAKSSQVFSADPEKLWEEFMKETVFRL